MAAVQRKLVHKQFNSPMGLYSQQNVKETLDRELKAFGEDGIEVDEQIAKSLNLANSAVLRAVEEEEEMKCGYKRVAWPPVSEERIVREFTPQPAGQFPPPQQYNPSQQYQQQQHQPAQAGGAPTAAAASVSAPGTSTAPATQQQQTYRATSHDNYQAPTSPQQQQYQSQYHQPSPSQQYHQQQQPQSAAQPQYQSQAYQPQQPSWAHQQQQPQVAAPLQQQQYQFEPAQNQFDSYSQPQQPYPQDYRGASPGVITLRKEAPVSQKPAPVYTSQPAAVSYQGGSNMRGDLKWPPPEYKEQAARENEERRQLALGPVCRPRRINRDYRPFFEKNAINSYYPSYKVPPGTQHMFA